MLTSCSLFQTLFDKGNVGGGRERSPARQHHATRRPPPRAERGGGGRGGYSAAVVAPDPTAANEMGSVDPMYNMAARIGSSHEWSPDTTRQRFLTLCNQLGKVNLRGMSYPLLAVLNVVELLKYWHMKYDADDDDSSQTPCSQTGRCHSSPAVCNIAPCTIRDVCMFSLIFLLDSLIIMYITLTPILFSPCILFVYFFNVRASL